MNLLEENVVSAHFSHVTRYKISVCLLHLLSKNIKIRFSDHLFFVGPEAVSVLYDPINDFWLKQCLKEKIGKFMERKNVTLKEKHLHAK